MPKKQPTRKEKNYMARIASLPCIACGDHDVEVHHIRTGQGMSQRASDFLTMPLCVEHHRGEYSTHGKDRRLFHANYGDELALLAKTIERLN